MCLLCPVNRIGGNKILRGLKLSYRPARLTLPRHSQVNSFYFTICIEALKQVSISCPTISGAKVKPSGTEYCHYNEQLCLFHKLWCDEIVIICIYFLHWNEKEHFYLNPQPVCSLLLFLNSANNSRDTYPLLGNSGHYFTWNAWTISLMEICS